MRGPESQEQLKQALSDLTLSSESAGWSRQLIAYLLMGGHVNDRDCLGWSLLHTAALGIDVEPLRWLVEMGADVSARDFQGQTPLHYAVEEAYRRVLEWDWNLDLGVVRELLVLGADPLVRDHSGRTPRDLVRAYGPSALAEYDAAVYRPWVRAHRRPREDGCLSARGDNT